MVSAICRTLPSVHACCAGSFSGAAFCFRSGLPTGCGRGKPPGPCEGCQASEQCLTSRPYPPAHPAEDLT